jgi:uncharacterized protein YycO
MNSRFKKLLFIFLLFFILAICFEKFFGLVWLDNKPSQIIQYETGDLLFRANSSILSNSKFYFKSGLPGHVGIVVNNGEFISTDRNMGGCIVAEARFYDHTNKKIAKKVSIQSASENFGRSVGRRILLKNNLSMEQKKILLKFIDGSVGKPFELFAPKDDLNTFNCATFARSALLISTGEDIDFDRGRIVFPNDILKSTLFEDDSKRVHF